MTAVYWGKAEILPAREGGDGEFVEHDGERFYKISNFQAMPPFFMTVVSGFDHWMFVSSTGGMTCGRRNPENALFPYYSDDKIHDAHATTGPQSILRVRRDNAEFLWKPFARGVTVYEVERNLYKSALGNRLIFEEVNRDLSLVFSYRWSTGDRFGFIRRSQIRNIGPGTVRVEVLDGLRNLLPCGVSRAMQATMSTLVDAYKQAESHPGLGAAIYTLSSVPSDRAEPNEALAATVAWAVGLDEPQLLLSEDQVPAFSAGAEVSTETFSRGRRGAFFVQTVLTFAAETERSWYLVADVGQGPAEVPDLFALIRRGVSVETLELDIARGSHELLRLTGSADGCQHSKDKLITARHYSSSLFNVMRGGVFYRAYDFPAADFFDFVGAWNRTLRSNLEQILGSASGYLSLADLVAAGERSCPDLQRLALEYLPLTFSRRHGDPSRPWNHFSIDTRNADGSDRLYYQGNWRDIFQNWEALAISHPEFIESFIAKFVNASTVDGYNPYRISRDGFEWEVLEPDDPWSNIGYWGDHQVNYLLRFLELSRRYHPGRLADLMKRDIFVYADVPYRLRGYADLVRDSRNTVDYDEERAAAVAERVRRLGSDGRLVTLESGSIYRVNLLEKLLVPALAKIVNLVPGGGIWMNTQRPEWNDANNALVGHGLSMVTLCYLRRYLLLMVELLVEFDQDLSTVSPAVRDLFVGAASVLQKHMGLLGGTVDASRRKAFVDEMGEIGEAYRASVYAGFPGHKADLETRDLLDFLRLALDYLNHSIGESRRADGLFHAYRLVHFEQDGYAVEDLEVMLEGQVAVLNSGYLEPRESLALLDALRVSELYCENRDSYLLYPDRKLPLFLEKNVIPQSLVDASRWIRAELDSDHSHYLVRDAEGGAHFKRRFCNAVELQQTLQGDTAVTAADAAALRKVYESVFRHRQFTGRSGSMCKYEGLGCIYWHMVSKLALSVAEVFSEASRGGADTGLLDAIFRRFEQIRGGLGLYGTPARYGAFPIDPYSHTPGFAGVQQPGMTGQVKEDIILRFVELGVRGSDGEIAFEPLLLRREEFLAKAETWRYSVGGEERSMKLESGSMAFTLCGVPVIYALGESTMIRVFPVDGVGEVIEGTRLGPDWSQSLFQRDGRVQKIEVRLPPSALR